MMISPRRSTSARYAGAVLSVLVAMAARLVLDPVLDDQSPYLTFFVAVLFAAWYGGFGPALLALGLGALAATYFIVRREGATAVHQLGIWVGGGLFFFVGITSALLSESLRRAQRRAEANESEALRQSERLRVTLESIGDAVIATDAQGLVTSMNRMAEELTGWIAAEAAGKPLTEVFRIEAVEGADYERLLTKNGTARAIEENLTPIRGESGRAVGRVIVFRDVAERRQADVALRESEQRFRQLADTMPQIVWTAEPDGLVDYFNGWWYDYTGMSPLESLTDDGWKGVIHPDDVGALFAVRNLAVGQAEFFESESRLRDREGNYRWHLVRSIPALDASGRLLRRFGTATDIDDRKRAEESLRAKEERLRYFIEHAPAAIAMLDRQRRYLLVSRRWLSDFGLSGREVIGRDHEEVFPDLPERWKAVYERCLGGAVESSEEDFFERPDGTGEWLRWEVRPWRDDQGEIGGILIFSENITARKRAEAALRASEERFRGIAGALPQIVWVSGDANEVEYYNERWFDYTGLTAEEAYSPDGWRLTVHPDDIDPIFAASVRSNETGQPFEAEYRLKHRSGLYRWHLGRAVAVRDETGRVVSRFGTATDIDDRKRAEDAARFLAEASATLSALVDETVALEKVAHLAVPSFADWCVVDMTAEGAVHRLAVAHVDPAKIEYAHELNARYPSDSSAAQGVPHVIRSGESEMVSEITDEMLAAGARDEEHLRILRQLGLKSYMCVPLKGRSGILGAISFVSAESDRRFYAADLLLAEDLAHRAAIAIENARLFGELKTADRRKGELLVSLRESEDRFRTMADSIPQLAWTARPDGHIFWYNKRWYDYTGTTPEEMEGWGWQSVHDPAELPRVLEKFKAALISEDPWEDTFPLRRRDGAMRWHLSRALPLRDDQGRVVCWFGTNTDITERREMEEVLKEADRRKNVFLATLAHELRNPLAPIRNALHLMKLGPSDGIDTEAERAMAERQVAHVARLVDDLMDVSRINEGKIELRKETVELASVVNSAIGAVRSLLQERGHVVTVTLPEEPIRLEADPTRLEQVLWNLLNNAIKYTEPGGRVALSVERADGVVVLRIRDTGTGIAPEMLPRIFEMFVQAPNHADLAQGGLGIGLGLVRTLVELHGGRIIARSDGPGLGSEFVVTLPAVSEPPAPPPPGTRDRARSTERPPRRRVLVVDDNKDAATTLARLLERVYGQEVRVAHDGPSALAIASDFGPELILLDIGMPGMDGYEVARQLRGQSRFTGTFLAALTGWGQEADRLRSKQAGFDRHLVKPVDPDALRGLIAEVP